MKDKRENLLREVSSKLVVEEDLAMEWLCTQHLDQMKKLWLVSRKICLVMDLIGGNHKGTLGAGIAIQEHGEKLGHPRGGDDVHVQGHGVVSDAVLPGNVPQVVLWVVVSCSPCRVLSCEDLPSKTLENICRVLARL